jgi:putative oxidoreductase
MTSMLQTFATLPARVLISLIFLMSGVGKIFGFSDTAEAMRNQGMVAAPLLLVGAMLLEIAGGFSLMLGYRARLGAMLLIIFLIPATLIFHDFWTFSGEEQQAEIGNFMKNLALIGGLLMFVAHGAGRLSLDARSHKLPRQ